MSSSYDEIKCPFCGYSNSLDPEYAYSIEEDEHYEHECYGCEKTFIITHNVSHDWYTQCPDHEHDLVPDAKYEGWGTCTHCDEFMKLKK